MNIRGRLALLLSIVFGFVIASAAKQSFSPYSWAPIFIGLFAYVFARLVFWMAFLLWDVVAWGKNKFAK